MLRIILIVLGVIAVILAGFSAVVAMQPADFQIIRNATMDAPPEIVFPHVNDLHKWEEWSPWAKLDPNVKNTFAGSETGKGASFTWSGNDEVGEGTMTITESRPNEMIRMNLHFVRPFEDTSDTMFIFAPQDQRTVVVWTMSGRKNFISKAVCMFMDMDKMLGDQFEEGLSKLNAIVSAEAAQSRQAETPAAKAS